ncbi:MAG: hypothetical protein RL367_2657 [Pseudomonadota bacterium]|jgi:hypothetical protein
MGRVIGIYGVIGGIIVAIGMLAGMTLVPEGGIAGMVVGYLTMLIALSMVFVGVKHYRDTTKGGVVRFWPACGIGLGIALVAGLFYVATWELYEYLTNYTFVDKYAASALESMRAAGKPAPEIAKMASEMAAFKLQYANPLTRMAMTFSEIAPVGLLVSVVSAALLRKTSFMPARGR